VAEDGKKAKQIDRLIISTDDNQIASVAEGCGIEVPFIRPPELATDDTSSLDVIAHALTTLEEEGEYYDAVCLLQPTSPFKPAGFIDRCISRFKEIDADCLISVLEVPHQYNPHWVFEEQKSGFITVATGEKDLIKRRQELPAAYFRDGSVYVIKKENIIVHGALLSGDISFVLSNPDYYCNLDTWSDWIRAENHPLVKVDNS